MNSFSLLQDMLYRNNNTKAINFLIRGIEYELGRLDDDKRNKFTTGGGISNQLRINGYTNSELSRLWDLYSRIVQETPGVDSEQIASLNKQIQNLKEDNEDLQDEEEDFLKIQNCITTTDVYNYELDKTKRDFVYRINDALTTIGDIKSTPINTLNQNIHTILNGLSSRHKVLVLINLPLIYIVHEYYANIGSIPQKIRHLYNQLQEYFNLMIIKMTYDINDATLDPEIKILELKNKQNIEKYFRSINRKMIEINKDKIIKEFHDYIRS